MDGLDGLLESLWDLLGGLDGSAGGLLVICEASWEDLGASWSLLEPPGALLERSWSLLERSWNFLERFQKPPGTLLVSFGRLLQGFWKPFQSWGCVFEEIC